eukprot:1119806-Rhodomonas_salina.1
MVPVGRNPDGDGFRNPPARKWVGQNKASSPSNLLARRRTKRRSRVSPMGMPEPVTHANTTSDPREYG